MPKILIDAKKVVQITGDHSGYKSGQCLCCEASGWLDYPHYGYPFGTKGKETKVVHKRSCPMNKVLGPRGGLTKRK
jgi:hypothetical protein